MHTGEIILGVCAVATLVISVTVMVLRGGVHSGKLAEKIGQQTEATRENTSATRDLSVAFTDHRARTETRLEDHDRRLDDHADSIAKLRQRPSARQEGG